MADQELPIHYEETPAYIGGVVGRAGPNYGEDNEYVFRDLLGFSENQLDRLVEEGVL